MKNDKRKLATITIFLGGILCYSLYAVEEHDLMDELVSATKSHNHAKVKQVSEKLVKMGDEAIPFLKKGFDLKNKPLTGAIMQILKNVKTTASTKMLLDLTGKWKDTQEGEYYIVRGAMQELQNRDIDVEIDKELLDFMLKKLQEGELFFAPSAARILGKMKKVDPRKRTESLLTALKREISEQSESKAPQRLLLRSYCTESEYKIFQYIYALEDIGTPAIPFISSALDTTGDNKCKEYLTICLGLTSDKKTLLPEVKSGVIDLAKNSTDGYIRTLGIQILGEWKNEALIPLLKDALNDNFKIAVKTDVITPDTQKDANGYYYYDYYPVRSEAFSALVKLGVKVESKGKGIYKVVE